MKTKLIKNLKSRVLLVEIPEDKSYSIQGVNLNGVETISNIVIGADNNYLPDGKWQLLSTLKDLTNEQLWKLVSMHKVSNSHWKYANYKNLSGLWFDAAKESFLSALEAEGVLFENHLAKPLFSRHTAPQDYDEIIIKFKEAEQNVFSPETLIFVEL